MNIGWGNHKCERCDRIYACECLKEHKKKAPAYDCGTCVHRSETIKGVQTYNLILGGDKATDSLGPINGKRSGYRS